MEGSRIVIGELDLVPNRAVAQRPSKRKPSAGHGGSGVYAVFLYVLYCKGYAKVGISELPRVRLGALQSGNPFPIELLASYKLAQADAEQAERQTMLRLDPHHTLGEWFKCPRKVALFAAAEACKPLGTEAASLPVKVRGHPRLHRKVQTPSGVFASADDAARHHGLKRRHARDKASTGHQGWEYVPFETPVTQAPLPPAKVPRVQPWRGIVKGSRQIQTPDGVFGGITVAARHHGVSVALAHHRAKNERGGWKYLTAGLPTRKAQKEKPDGPPPA